MTNDIHKKSILEFILFYGTMGRAASFMEIQTRTPNIADENIVETIHALQELAKEERIVSENGFFAPKKLEQLTTTRTSQDFLLDSKWKKLLKIAKWFRYIPYVEFVLVSGSMSFGAIRKTSDFDIVLGVKQGRIFTARYLVSGFFSLLRARRLDDFEASSPDKFCFNHIITPSTYEKFPHNYYRYELYRHIIPIFIDGPAYEEFRGKNAWADISELNRQMVPQEKRSSIKAFLEYILNGTLGNYIETRIAKPIAMKRLSSYINQKQNEGRVVINENELEFHFQLNYEKEFSAFSVPNN